MELGTILTAVSSSLGLSMAGFYWLSKTAIQHGRAQALEGRKAEFAKELEGHKAALTEELEEKKASLQSVLTRDKAEVEGAIKREVELYLGERAAQRQYEFEARKRLYLAVGPLRFQLLLACRDCAGRIWGHATRERYRMDIAGYYGRSTLYRLLRPLAIAELIERQIAYSDFAVDDNALDCLRFKKSAIRMLSGDEVVGKHPRLNWNRQVEHVYADSLAVAANALVSAAPGAGERVMRFDEFDRLISENGGSRFDPFPDLLTDFEITSKPILWLRLVAYGNVCNNFVNQVGKSVGFQHESFPVNELIAACADAYILERKTEYERTIAAHTLMPL